MKIVIKVLLRNKRKKVRLEIWRCFCHKQPFCTHSRRFQTLRYRKQVKSFKIFSNSRIKTIKSDTYFMCDSVYVRRGMARRRSSALSASNSLPSSGNSGSFPCITPPNSPQRIPPMTKRPAYKYTLNLKGLLTNILANIPNYIIASQSSCENKHNLVC